MGIWGGLGSLGGSIVGGFMGNRAQKAANEANLQGTRETNSTNRQIARTANKFNAEQVQKQMDFQQEMSNTAYQRATQDMKAAGLNPMLAYSQGGASTPSGASAMATQIAAQAPHVEAVDSMAKAISTGAGDAARVYKEFRAMDSQSQLNKQSGQAAVANAKLSDASAKTAAATEARINAELPAVRAEAELRKKQATLDKKYAEYDAIMGRAGTATGIINNAVDIIKPRILRGGSNERETIIDSRTGEVLDELRGGRSSRSRIPSRPHVWRNIP